MQSLCITGIDGDALAQSFLDSGTVNEQEGWVQGFDPAVLQNAQTEAQQKLQDYITNNMTDPTVGDVIGGRRTIVKEYPVLPSGLPNRVVVTGKRYAELPNALRNTMTFAFGKDYLGTLEDPVSFPWATVNNARITYQVKIPLETQAPYTYKVIAGSYLALASIGEGVGSQKLKELQTRLRDTKTKLESQDQAQIASLTREDILGDIFHAGVLGYFAEYSAISYFMALQQRVGHNLAIGYGSYGYEPKVSYFFGIPRAIEPGGVVMNVRLGDYVATQGNNNEKRIQFRQRIGLLSSALESAIPEQMFVTPENPGEAVSAVKALAKANQQGQKIYHITQANMATVLPNIHHDSLVMDDIRSALAAGKEVMTHTDDVSVPGWTGAGYIIMDPHTGIGAYKIGGGENGAIIAIAFAVVMMSVALLLALEAGAIFFIGWEFLNIGLFLYSLATSESPQDAITASFGAFISALMGMYPESLMIGLSKGLHEVYMIEWLIDIYLTGMGVFSLFD